MGQPEKNFDTFTPSRVAEVIRTFKFEDRVLTKRFINPTNMSLHKETRLRAKFPLLVRNTC